MQDDKKRAQEDKEKENRMALRYEALNGFNLQLIGLSHPFSDLLFFKVRYSKFYDSLIYRTLHLLLF